MHRMNHTYKLGPTIKLKILCFFSKKNILIPNVAEKNILILVQEKKKSDSEFLSYNLMFNSGKKIALCTTKKINILTLVLYWKKNSERNKNHNPPSPPPPLISLRLGFRRNFRTDRKFLRNPNLNEITSPPCKLNGRSLTINIFENSLKMENLPV